MKLRSVALAALMLVSTAACSRDRQEAVILANEGDKVVKSNVDAAIEKYDQATRLDPNNHHIFFKLAMAHKKKTEWDKVASVLARATQVAPQWADYWFWRGYALEQQAIKGTIGYEDAKEPYIKCIEADPNYADCYAQLANVYLWTDDEQKALENYTKAIEHDPTTMRYYANLADLYIRLGYMAEAEQALKEAKAFAKPGDPDLFGVHILLSQVYQDRGDINAMVPELEAAQALPTEDGREVELLFSLGSTYAQLDRRQQAIDMLKGFYARACKGALAKQYQTECETTSTLVTQKLGGTLQ